MNSSHEVYLLVILVFILEVCLGREFECQKVRYDTQSYAYSYDHCPEYTELPDEHS